MACPDELTLDLWLANALTPDEGATVASHVRTCAACSAATIVHEQLERELHQALALDADELQFLAELDLAATWRDRVATATAPSGWWIALLGVVAGFVAWMVAAPSIGWLVNTAAQVGVLTLLVNTVLTVLFSLGQAVFELIGNPYLGWTQPLLALLALALLAWPRQLIAQRSTHA